MFSISRKTVYNDVSRAENEGSLEAKGGSGRKRKIGKRAGCLILRKVVQNPQISKRTIAQDLKQECDLIVSHETVRQAILRHRAFLVIQTAQ